MKLGEGYEKFYTELVSRQLKRETLRSYRSYWNNYFRLLQGREINDIECSELERILSQAPATTRNRLITYGRQMFDYFETQLSTGPGNSIFRGFKKAKENPRKRFVHADEWRRLSKGLITLAKGNKDERDFALYVRLLIFSGMRKAEAEMARFENIDFERSVILVSGKTGEREVPLVPIILEQLKQKKQDVGFIFKAKKSNSKGRNFSYRWRKFRKEIGLQDVTRHDLRRTFGVTGLNNGLSMEEVQGLLGHSSIVTTQRSYAWLTTDSKKKAATKLATTLEKNLA